MFSSRPSNHLNFTSNHCPRPAAAPDFWKKKTFVGYTIPQMRTVSAMMRWNFLVPSRIGLHPATCRTMSNHTLSRTVLLNYVYLSPLLPILSLFNLRLMSGPQRQTQGHWNPFSFPFPSMAILFCFSPVFIYIFDTIYFSCV